MLQSFKAANSIVRFDFQAETEYNNIKAVTTVIVRGRTSPNQISTLFPSSPSPSLILSPLLPLKSSQS